MNYHAEITIKKDIENLYKSFLPEIASTPRAIINLKKTDNKLKFIIEAQDSVALRAILNSITKLLDVYEKVQK
ncbi:hypothetical protein J4418_00625 [Candidatus Woesearchaeota archaeon]|nr:hypothetical protein [Candidatus Woesearchaeota archaeon]